MVWYGTVRYGMVSYDIVEHLVDDEGGQHEGGGHVEGGPVQPGLKLHLLGGIHHPGGDVGGNGEPADAPAAEVEGAGEERLPGHGALRQEGEGPRAPHRPDRREQRPQGRRQAPEHAAQVQLLHGAGLLLIVRCSHGGGGGGGGDGPLVEMAVWSGLGLVTD